MILSPSVHCYFGGPLSAVLFNFKQPQENPLLSVGAGRLVQLAKTAENGLQGARAISRRYH